MSRLSPGASFAVLILGQVVSLFGNATARFALPLFLLNQTGSSLLFGAVAALAMVPSIVATPLGGVLADRTSKKWIMVTLDALTSAAVFGFCALAGIVNTTVLVACALVVLYAIAGLYQPSVQASIPFLVAPEKIGAANSLVSTVSSLASLLGPAVGGLAYSVFGLEQVLGACGACFVLAALVETLMNIPRPLEGSGEGEPQGFLEDLRAGLRYVVHERPELGKVTLAACGVNLVMASALVVGLPFVITEKLGFALELANQLYGYAEGALALGGILGAIVAGTVSSRGRMPGLVAVIGVCASCLLAMGLGCLPIVPHWVAYATLVAGSIVAMVFSTVFTIVVTTLIQTAVRADYVGKSLALFFTACMAAQPVGNLLYGFLFDQFGDAVALVFVFAGACGWLLALASRTTARNLTERMDRTH